MTLSGSTTVHELLSSHPFLEDFLAARSPKFEMLKNRMARATIGRVATLQTAAGVADLDLATLLGELATEIHRATGVRPEVAAHLEVAASTRGARIAVLKDIIGRLHAGGDLAEARTRFMQALGDVEASEIAAMEEELIRDGLPVSEVQRLCDVHVGAFRPALDAHQGADVPPGHPVHTYRVANRIITELANGLADAARGLATGQDVDANLDRALDLLDQLRGVDNHYQRKENQLFALLERHGVTGPSQVMWGVHDQIRRKLQDARAAAATRAAQMLADAAPGLARDLVEMVYKEEKILFPMSLRTLSESEWIEARQGEDGLGYVLAHPAAPWPLGQGALPPEVPAAGADLLALLTGALSLEQLNLILTYLPVDLSFVDETDTVRFYSEGPVRIFPRSPAVIGRKVQNCHPPKSLHLVEEILGSFRAGSRDVAEFWIRFHDRLIHIRYFAVRDRSGLYRGCLEVSQDVTEIRRLEGERRLLVWETSPPLEAQTGDAPIAGAY